MLKQAFAIVLAAFVAVSSTVFGAEVDDVNVATLTKDQWREDVQYFARELAKRHKNAFHTLPKADYDRTVASLEADLPSLTYQQIVVRMLQITAAVGDGHTKLLLPASFRLYPFGLYWYGGDLRVVRAAEEYKDVLGTKLVKVGGLDIAEVNKRVLSVCARAENEWADMINTPQYIVRPEVLFTLGITPAMDKASFVFETDDGRKLDLEVPATEITPELGKRMQNAAAAEPISRQKAAESFPAFYIPESKAVYANWRSYEKLDERAGEVFKLIDSNPTEKLIIDLRFNGGGDFFKGRKHVISEIKKRPAINQKGRLYVIIGRRTFSAVMVNAVDFRKETNATLVGEPIGERPNSYSEKESMTLPNSKIVVSYSVKYYKFVDDGPNIVSPDKRLDPDWASFKAGRDNVLDWILKN
jgi:hypothetical protein